VVEALSFIRGAAALGAAGEGWVAAGFSHGGAGSVAIPGKAEEYGTTRAPRLVRLSRDFGECRNGGGHSLAGRGCDGR